MKSLLKTFSTLCLSAAVATASLPAHATPVWFPLVGITGSANNRDITIVPDVATNVLVYGSNLVALQTLLIHPVQGNATNNLLPWGYTLRVDGWPRSAHFVVPNQTNVVNVTTLITNATALGFPVSFGFNPTGFSGAVTNVAGSSYAVVTNTLIRLSGASYAAVNQTYTGIATDAYLDGTYYGTNGGWTITVVSSGGAALVSNGSQSPYTGPGPYPSGGPAWNWQQADGSGSPNAPSSTTVSTALGTGTNLVTHYNLTTFTNGVCSTNIFQ